jgi:signal transduction histidine kinase
MPDCSVKISVTDSGDGIPEADLQNIFKPFVSSKREGMGLGLAVCNTIIESHHGRLWAANNPAAGATVSFALPVLASEPAAIDPARSEVATAT